ncbi:MAG: hypothetical protein ABIY51_14460 [Ferruginibacter sp.]
MIKFILFICLFVSQLNIKAQKHKADSLFALLAVEKKDSNRVTLLWNLAIVKNAYNPDTALVLAREALFLSRKIRYTSAESKALGIIANSFLKIGNYPKALEFYLDKLKIEEQRNDAYNLASVTMNIGIVYVLQEEFRSALPYYYKADSLISVNKVTDLEYNIAINLGDVYNRLHINDSAFLYFQRSLAIAQRSQDKGLIGASMVGMGHSYASSEDYDKATLYYHDAINNLLAANDEDLACEAYLGIAKVFKTTLLLDSARNYATYALEIAMKDGFISWQLEAANFLTEHFKKINKSDSAFKYIQFAQVLKDSISSKEKVRASQVLSSNEQLRQSELAEAARIAKSERSQQLQYLFIGIFIPGLFLTTLFLSRKKVHIRVIRTMGIISLLMLFEYLTLLLHPRVVQLTGHTPVFEIMIFVCLAAILIPTHHRVERWLIETLTGKPGTSSDGKILLQTKKLVTKQPPSDN